MTINTGICVPLPYFTTDASLSKECAMRLDNYLDILTKDAKMQDDDIFLKSLSYWFNKQSDEEIEKFSFTLYVSDTWINSVIDWKMHSHSIVDAYIKGREYEKRFNNLIRQLMVIIEDES